jgi:hypothetical protein
VVTPLLRLKLGVGGYLVAEPSIRPASWCMCEGGNQAMHWLAHALVQAAVTAALLERTLVYCMLQLAVRPSEGSAGAHAGLTCDLLCNILHAPLLHTSQKRRSLSHPLQSWPLLPCCCRWQWLERARLESER